MKRRLQDNGQSIQPFDFTYFGWFYAQGYFPTRASCATFLAKLQPLLPLHLRQYRLGLWQPEGHLHRLVQVYGSRQLSTGMLPLAGRGIQRAEATVAVGHERAHAQFLGQGQSLLVVLFGRRDIGGGWRGYGGRQAGAARASVFSSFSCRAQSSAWRACCQASSPCPASRKTSLSQT
jgi:hypothetical protein